MTASQTGGTGPYSYAWTPPAPDAPTATYATTTIGNTPVSVVITDANGCESLPADGSFDVGGPIDGTLISCADITESTIGFCWEMVPGATGYNVTWTGAATGSLSATASDLCIPTISGLGITESVTITVIPIGDGPCGDGPPMTFTCSTDDCPDPDYVFAPTPLSYCEDSLVAPFTYLDEINAIDGGSFVFDDPAGGVNANGDFDPSVYAPGTYTITSVYNYPPSCSRPGPTITITVNPTPSAAFTLDPEVCIDDIANLDASGLTGSPVFDFDDPNGTVTLGNLSWDSPGPKTVTVNVTSAAGCVNSSQQMITVLDTLQPIIFLPCDTDINFVHFDWDDVTGATGYDLSWTTNQGGSGSETNWPNSDYTELNNLSQNETVTLTVTAVAGPGYCNTGPFTIDCTAGACDPLPAPIVSCAAEGADFVEFSWDPVVAVDGTTITDYIVSYPGNPDTTVTATTFLIDGLCPETSVNITVVSVNPDPLCQNSLPSNLSDVCTTDPCPVFDVSCDLGAVPAGSTSVVAFTWDNVPGVLEYQLSYSVDGGPNVPLPPQPAGDTEWMDNIFSAGQNVTLFVSAVFPSADGSGPVGDCPNPTFPDPNQTECWDGVSAISLEEPIITDDNGDAMTGTLTWTHPDVLSNGNFTPPDAVQSGTYVITYDFVDAVSLCSYPSMVTVNVNVKPTAMINNIDPLCVGSDATIQAMAFGDLAATGSWTFDNGNPGTETGEGPHIVNYDTPGMHLVTLVVESAPGCFSDDTATVQVDDVNQPIVFDGDCTFTNTSVTWSWNDLGTVYIVTVVNTDTGAIVEDWDDKQTFDNSLTLDNLTSDVVYEITVTVASQNTCPAIPASATCVPSSCPQSPFDVSQQYYFDEYCPGEAGVISLDATGYVTGPAGETVASETWTAVNPAHDAAINSSNGEFDADLITDLPALIEVEYVAIFSGDGCRYDTTFTIELWNDPFISEIIPAPVDCVEDVSPQFEIFASGGVEPYSFLIDNDPPANQVEQASTVFLVSSPGDYGVTVTDANGCTHTSTVNIATAEEPFVVLDGPTVMFNEDTGVFTASLEGTEAPITEVIWLIDGVPLEIAPDQDAVEVIASIAELGNSFEVTVQIYFDENCFKDATIRVEIIDTERIYIPNVISGGATENDNNRWRMYTKGSVTVDSYSIYDRWGELVYTKMINPELDSIKLTGPGETAVEWNLDWTGNWGTPAEIEGVAIQGVYVYVIEMRVDDAKEIEAGDLTIFR